MIAIASQIGAGIQEAFQLVDNAANVFYGIVYFTLFAIPHLWRGDSVRRADLAANRCDVRCCRLAVRDLLHHLPDHRCTQPVDFRGENHVVTVIANVIGVTIISSAADQKRRLGWRLTASVSSPATPSSNKSAQCHACEAWIENDLRHFVGMKRAQFFLKCRLSIFAQFEKDKRFVAVLDFLLPAIDRFDARQDVRAGGKFFGDQLIRNPFARFRRPETCSAPAEPLETNRHSSGTEAQDCRGLKTRYLRPSARPVSRHRRLARQIQPPPTTTSPIVNHRGLAGRHCPLWLVQTNSRAIIAPTRNRGRRPRMTVTNLHHHVERCAWIIRGRPGCGGPADPGYGMPIHAIDFEFVANQIFGIADDHAICFRIEIDDVTRPQRTARQVLCAGRS